MPSYNHGKYVSQCIESIVNQTYKNFELIVIDDGSTDNSITILKSLQKQYNFQLYLQKNIGLARTLNRGYRDLAKGELLTFCASDDYWIEDKLYKQVKFIVNNQNYAMVFGRVILVDKNGEILKKQKKTPKYGYGDIFKDVFLLKYHPPVNYLFRSDVMKELGYYDPDLWAEDFDMNLRISANYKVGFIDDYLSYYRVSNKGVNGFKTMNSHLKSIEKFEDHPLYKKAIRQWHYRAFCWYSAYKDAKKKAFIGMILNLDKFWQKRFIKSLYRLIFKWK